MKFTNRKDCSIWCDVYNRLWIAVERAGLSYEQKARQSDDPRIKKLESIIKTLADDYHKNLFRELKKIEEENKEWPPC